MAEAATTTPTLLSWSSGPESVQVTGSWDSWVERITLDKQADGSFSKSIPLPANTKVHYKFIVDGNWTTNPREPTANDGGNENNVVEVGPAPTQTEAATTKATEIGAGVAAGVTGAITAATTAAYKFTDHVNGNGNSTVDEKEVPATTEKKPLTDMEKKTDPAAGIRETADEDIRNSVPTSISSVSHAAIPVIASAVATITGADILRGNPEALPVSQKEINDTQAQAMKGDNGFLASRIEPQGGAISDPAAATTENAKAAASVANTATIGAPVVAVTNNGFAANITAQSGGLTTSADQGKEGGAKAAAIAGGSASAVGAAGLGGVAAASAVKKEDTEIKPAPTASKAAETKKQATTVPMTSKVASVDAAGIGAVSSPPTAAKSGPGASKAVESKKLPTIGPASSKTAADKATAPAAASSGPLARGKETTTPAAAPSITEKKSLPGTPPKKPVTRSSLKKTEEVVPEKTTHSRAVSSDSKSQTSGHTAMASGASSSPSTPDKTKKGLFGKIKQALSPATSPNSK